jgi:hypothetical protein
MIFVGEGFCFKWGIKKKREKGRGVKRKKKRRGKRKVSGK